VMTDAARDQARRDAASVQAEMVDTVGHTGWLSATARQAAAHKLGATALKLGFPGVWPATGDAALTGNFLDNVIATRSFAVRQDWARAQATRGAADTWDNVVYPNGAPGIAAARLMFPNGFPDVPSNSIELTAAMLVPPLYDPTAPLEVRLGGFGFVVAHELIHVVDNHEFDDRGAMHDIFPEADGKAHMARVGCVIRQADRFEVDGKHFKGDRMFGEANADYGGIVHAYGALAKALGPQLSAKAADGTTAAQRFFYAYAQHWCQAARPEARDSLRDDNHGPVQFRVNAPLSNLPGFAEAFSCPAGAAMARSAAERCTVW